MDDGLSFDVYVEITDPTWEVEHEAYDNRVSVVFGAPGAVPPDNLLHLWFKDPDTAVTLGHELTAAGMKLAAQLKASSSGSAGSGQANASEEYPVPDRKSNDVESGDER